MARELKGYYSEVASIEKDCGFANAPGIRASIYEGLIDWEDAAGFSNKDKREVWFRLINEIEKRESSIDILDGHLEGAPLFQAFQNCQKVYVANSLLSELSIDTVKSIIETGIDEMEEDGGLAKTQSFRSSQTGITHSIDVYFIAEDASYNLVVVEDSKKSLGIQEVSVAHFHNIREKIDFALSEIHRSGSDNMNN